MTNRTYRVTEIVGTSPRGSSRRSTTASSGPPRPCGTATGSRSPRSAARSRTARSSTSRSGSRSASGSRTRSRPRRLTADQIDGLGVALNEADWHDLTVDEPAASVDVLLTVLSRDETGEETVRPAPDPAADRLLAAGGVLPRRHLGRRGGAGAAARPRGAATGCCAGTAAARSTGWEFVDSPRSERAFRSWEHRLSLDLAMSGRGGHHLTLFQDLRRRAPPRRAGVVRGRLGARRLGPAARPGRVHRRRGALVGGDVRRGAVRPGAEHRRRGPGAARRRRWTLFRRTPR